MAIKGRVSSLLGIFSRWYELKEGLECFRMIYLVPPYVPPIGRNQARKVQKLESPSFAHGQTMIQMSHHVTNIENNRKKTVFDQNRLKYI